VHTVKEYTQTADSSSAKGHFQLQTLTSDISAFKVSVATILQDFLVV
jgi:hypothetical protein